MKPMKIYPSIAHLKLNLRTKLDTDILSLSERFPNLEILVVGTVIVLEDLPQIRTNLRCLTLLDRDTCAGDLAQYLGCLPALQEIKFGSCPRVLLSPNAPHLADPIAPPSLEILALRGEDLIMFLEYLITPSLKLFGLEGYGDGLATLDIVKLFLRRCCLGPVMVSLKGWFRHSLLASFTWILPLNTRLHIAIDVQNNYKRDDESDDESDDNSRRTASAVLFKSGSPKEIFCNDLEWFREGISVAGQNPSVKIFVPNAEGDEEYEKRRDQCGYDVEMDWCNLRHMIRAVFHPMTIQWDPSKWHQ